VIGTIAGSYRIVSKISEGGMGVVYRAEHTMIGRPVAVKVLLPELSNQRDIVTRFFNEARAATAVRHPGIVEIFDFGYMPSGQAYLVMELLAGESDPPVACAGSARCPRPTRRR
jgi:serine/threonine protein kinase